MVVGSRGTRLPPGKWIVRLATSRQLSVADCVMPFLRRL